MMDTCADYYSNTLTTSSCTAKVIDSSNHNDDHDSGNNLGSTAAPSSSSSSSSSSLERSTAQPATTTTTTNHHPHHQHSIHPLLQHTSHPQHLIAPVAPQLAAISSSSSSSVVVPPPSAVVAPTITNHHPQQPLKFPHVVAGSNGATGYSTSSSSVAGAHSSSVVNGTSTGTAVGGNNSSSGHQLQATVYPIQHQPRNPSPLGNSPLESLKASVITENPFDTYHHHQVQQQQTNYLQHHQQSVDNCAAGGLNGNLWSPTTGLGRSDQQLSGGGGIGGYVDSVRSGYGGNLSSNCLLTTPAGGADYNLNAFGDNGLTQQGTNSNVGYAYPNQSYEGAGGAGGGGGNDGGGVGSTSMDSVIDYQGSMAGAKCNYNNSSTSSSPIISSQTATSPFQYNSGQQQQQHHHQQQQQQTFVNNSGMLPNGMSSAGRGSHHPHLNVVNGQMRSVGGSSGAPQHSTFDVSSTRAGSMDYHPQSAHYHGTVPTAQVASNGHLAEGLSQSRTYLDLSASKPQANPVSYYAPQAHAVGQKTKRFGVYEEPAPSQYMLHDPSYAYNGYKPSHPSLVQMPAHANQMSRAHYNRPGMAVGQGTVAGPPPPPTHSHAQLDPKYRRSYAMYKNESSLKASHLNYPHHPHHAQYGSYGNTTTTDPLTGKRLPNYPQTVPHQGMHVPSGYSEQMYTDLDGTKKKAVYPSLPPGKYAYSYMGHGGGGNVPPAGQYALSNMHPPPSHGIHGTPSRSNYYPNGFVNYQPTQHHHHQQQQQPQHHHQIPSGAVMNGYGGSYYPNPPAMNSQQTGAEIYGHSNYLKSHSHGMPKGGNGSSSSHDPHPIEAMGKLNRNCYYDTNVPPAGEKTYVDLEDEISGSKITKVRNAYAMNADYHHQPYYDSHQPPGPHAMSPYNAKYCQERYLYHHGHQQSSLVPPPHPSTYYPGMGGGGSGAAAVTAHNQSHLGHHMLHGDGHGMQSYGAAAVAGKNINVRDFLSSWNDDEEEVVAAGAFGGNYQQGGVGDPNSLQRIQVGISIDKSNLTDSTGTMNLPDIIIDIEKQKPAIPEIDLTDDGNEETTAPAGAMGTSSSEEKLYVLESIDVPLSELNKYKHLNVINKLPENIVHLRDGGEVLFNESELIHSEVTDDATVAESMKLDSGVENSLKFIEEIESNSDFKNDFELNVEYESFPNQKPPEVTSSTSPTPVVESSSASLAELYTRAEDLIANQRKESVIVGMTKKVKVKSESGRKKRKFEKALRAQLKLLKEQQLQEEANALHVDEGNSDEEDVVCKKGFKSLVKCCLDVINTKQFRRNANKYLPPGEFQVSRLSAQDESPVPRSYKFLRRFCQKSEVQEQVLSPKSLREMCAEVVIACNLVTIQEEFECDEVVQQRTSVLIEDGQVPSLRDLCEHVLRQTNFIIDVDDFCQLDNPELSEKQLEEDDFENNNSLDDNNNDQNQMVLISGLTQQEQMEMDNEGDGGEVDELVEGTSCGANNIQSESVDLTVPSAYLYQEDALMSCDYFLAEAGGDDQIQFSEEVVPVDPDRHKRKMVTDQLRHKYVHNTNHIHALDSRRMILKKYFYYQKHVALVRQMIEQSQQRCRRRRGEVSESVVVALRKRYVRSMRCRQRWLKKSKSIVIEPVGVSQPPQLLPLLPPPPLSQQIIIRPGAIVSQSASSSPTTTTTPTSSSERRSSISSSEVATSSDCEVSKRSAETIMKLITGGIVDMTRKKSHSQEDSTDDKSDTELIMVTVEKATREQDRKKKSEESGKIGEEKRSYKSNFKELERQRSRKDSEQAKKKSKSSREEAKITKVKNNEESVKREREESDQKYPSRFEFEASKEHRPRLEESGRGREENIGHPRKKVKPKFDDILLGIDDIYKSSSSAAVSSAKVKPKLNVKALKAFELVDESSVSSPSSAISSSSSSTTGSSGSSSSSGGSSGSSFSKKSKSSSISSTSSTSSSSSSTSAAIKRRQSVSSSRSSSSSSSSTSSSLLNSGSVKSWTSHREKGRQSQKGIVSAEESKKVGESYQQRPTAQVSAVSVEEKRPIAGPKSQKRRKLSEAEMVAMAAMKEKLIIKTAVVQLERDGYIDKLGKLYT